MKAIRNIIFDLGGVLFDINYQNIIDSFNELGLDKFEASYTQLKQDHLFDLLETGNISAQEFRNKIRNISKTVLRDEQIDNAWNSILIGFPDRNIELLKNLAADYRIFLLSNTNEIHETAFRKMLASQKDKPILEDLFEKVYLSHRVHFRKPDAEIFNLVIEENKLNAAETLFIDDSPQHVQGALKVGLQAKWLENGEWVGDILDVLL